MNIPFSAHPSEWPDQTDTGPLSWVMGEIRDALGRSRTALLDAVAQDAESRSTSLYHAKTHLHQAHGALQMVDLDGVTIVTEAIEQLLERLAAAQIVLTQSHADIVGEAYQALIEYLEHLLSGARQQALRLYPYHKAILEALGASRIHPADLFFPQLAEPLPAIDMQQMPQAASSAPHASYADLRQRFEMALLPFLKNSQPALESGGAAAMRAVIAEIEQAQTEPQARRFWWVMHGFAEAVCCGQIAGGRFVKQLFALLNLQIRRLAQGSHSISESLLRDALFFIAQIEHPSGAVLAMRAAFRIEAKVPADFEVRRYGQIDLEALRSAKEGLERAKSIWSRIADGDAGLAENFEREMKTLAAASEKLNSPSLAQLFRELESIARHAAHASPDQGICMETATGLLFVEQALDNISHLGADFSGRADALCCRLISIVAGEAPAASAQWLAELSEEAQQRQTLCVLATEMQANLRQVERSLEEYFTDPAKKELLRDLEPALHQIAGAMALLEQDDARFAVERVQAAVRGFADGLPEAPAELLAYQDVAQNVGALGFFLEMLATNPSAARSRFAFDAQGGIFHAKLFEKAGAAADAAVLCNTAAQAEAAGPGSPERQRIATVEDDLARHHRQAAGLADSLLEAPFDAELQQQLKSALQSVRSDAALIDDRALMRRTQTTIDLLAQPGFVATPQALEGVASCAAAAAIAVAPVASVSTAAATDGDIDAELLEIFISEAEEVLALVMQTLPLSRQDSHNQEHLATLRRSFHTLKGSGRMVGLSVFGNAAWSIEQVMNLWLSEARSASAGLHALLDMAAQQMQAWVAEIKLHGQSGRSADALVQAAERVQSGQAPELTALAGDLPDELAAPAAPAALPETADPEPSAPDFDFNLELALPQDPAPEPAPEPTPAPVPASGVVGFPAENNARPDDNLKKIGDIEVSLPLHTIYLAETDEIVRLLSNDFSEWRHEAGRAVSPEAINAAHTLCGSSATVGFTGLHDLARELEKLLQHLARQPAMLEAIEFDAIDQCVAHCKSMLQSFALGEMPPLPLAQIRLLESLHLLLKQRPAAGNAEEEAAKVLLLAAPAVLPAPEEPLLAAGTAAHDDYAYAAGEVPIQDELDADLLPLFIEEGSDLLPEIGRLLRTWQQAPADTGLPQALLRALHTVKGSARMAGAMALGQHAHEIESRIGQLMQAGAAGAPALEELLASHDHSLSLFEQLQHPAPVAVPAAPAKLSGDAGMPAHQSAAALSPAAPLMRVRADIIDRLVNQAGEVSISRSRLETGVDTLRSSLSELTESVSRLRGQLREIEMQAESQIMSLMPQSCDREFDPLEFDRFTRLQELTRMMAESVGDVASVQQNMARTVEAAGADLGQQARLTRDLQQDLMRVRMVPFASVSERLYRVARQAAKETGKRVNLEIRGAAVELDRSVLEKMAAPFEHLLRNAIAHGIEPREQRRALGKTDAGELLVQVRQEGNEVVIRISDDGCGLDLARIRAKAGSAGLLGIDGTLSDAAAMDLILQPGFSTATEITALSGRGIGLDVVHEEVAALGGRVAISSSAGQGASFTIHLPLTLAVTQVVLLEADGNTYAVPSALVEQVQQLKGPALASAYSEAGIVWQGRRVELHNLSDLLADDAAITPAGRNSQNSQYSPVIILRSGNDRVAIHVDRVLGNREVVVKDIGPQLARMVGIAGATVLGSGEIVLILNPVALASGAARTRAQRLTPSDGPGAVAAPSRLFDLAAGSSDTAPDPRTQRIVMVVDDSLTVRRVTQRLLARAGYQVALAKDGVDALEQLQSITPDVMLVDIEMPRMDGFDLTRNVRSDARTRHIPIIMITSRTADKHRNYAMELGVDAYFGKPYQEDALLQSIADHIGLALPAL